MSFFDEVDEPRTTPPRSQPRRRRPSGGGGGSGGRRPPSNQQSVQARRGVAAAALLIVVVLLALGVKSCQDAARTSALKDYTNSVSSLIQQSAATGTSLFRILSSGASASSASSLQNQVNQDRADAAKQLHSAQGLSVPDAARGAQQSVVKALQMRVDGITTIANEIQPALGTSTAADAVQAIAVAMARFYASDVLYKLYAAPAIAGALHGAGIAVGAPNGQAISGKQFLPSIRWLDPLQIAAILHASLPAGHHKVAPGLHGHVLNSVSVNGTQLQPGATNTLPANPPPTFTLNYTNGGTNDETNVVCKVTVSGTSVSGTKTIPRTIAGQSGTCSVTLSSSPGAGTQTVVATIEKVPGEKNTANNSLSFPVTFQ
ncbi:MAG TPA: hypothetical protein VFN55_17035 [Solirubrobacteraceae bacterium]|nr:hypothetical protein [Solirubrobacteraceae bacterium]